MDKFITWWFSGVNDGEPELFITDSSSTHLNEGTVRLIRQKRVIVAIIPRGCTMYIQALDVYVFSTFKHHHYECAEEWIERNGGRSKIKLAAAQSLIFCTRLVSAAWSRTLKSIDPLKFFLELGYVWKDDCIIRPPSLPGYVFDPTTVDYMSNKDPNVQDDERINEEARRTTEQHQRNLLNNAKLKTLLDLWRKT